MSLPDLLQPLLDPAAYPHACGPIRLVETHISWVFLTGDYAYKLKKPVRFPFVDFSTLARREHFCREELRCNRRFAPDLYLDVVAITRRGESPVAVAGAGAVVEWAVRMRQFPAAAELDRLLAAGRLEPAMLRGFGSDLAALHEALPRLEAAPTELDARVLAPVRDNFTALVGMAWLAPRAALLEGARNGVDSQFERLGQRLPARLRDGWMRECHGDLHLSNLVLLDGVVTAFDCLEFEPDLRWIDVQSDVAFLFMDLLVRGRSDLAYTFVDGYLDASGDYAGAGLLAFYASYRALVRAKVAGLRREQLDLAAAAGAAEAEEDCVRHITWAAGWLARPPGRLILMCGLSGSGKSWLASRLTGALPALRLRSDVARKRLAGLALAQPAGAAADQGLYAPERVADVYAALQDWAGTLLANGDHVIVDATFLQAARRDEFAAMARALGSRALVLYCAAPEAVLRARLDARAARAGTAAGDASDADQQILDRQLEGFQPPVASNLLPVIEVNTARWEVADDDATVAERLAALARAIAG
jgi:uncharacterized protein